MAEAFLHGDQHEYRRVVTLEAVGIEHSLEDLADDLGHFARAMLCSDLIVNGLVFETSESHQVCALSPGSPSCVIRVHIVGLLDDLFDPLRFFVDRSAIGPELERRLGQGALSQRDAGDFLE